MSAQSNAYFVPDADGLRPVPEARSPWSPDMLHGRLLAGLAAREVERADHDPALRLARLTVDMFRAPPLAPFTVTHTVVRDGRRVRAAEVSIGCFGVEVARASALLLRAGPHPAVHPWRAPEWEVPPPASTPAAPGENNPGDGWDIRPLTPGGFWTSDRKRVWARDTWQLVAGERPSPAVRAALAADLPNPLANSGAEGLPFINADLTLFLARHPVSEWIGLEVAAHQGADGIAIGTCTLYDTFGPIGSSSVCALANPVALGE